MTLIPIEMMQDSAKNMTPESLAAFVTDNRFDGEIADNIMADELDGSFILSSLNDDELLEELGMATAIQRLKFRCLFQRHLLNQVLVFPPEEVVAFCKTKPSLQPCIEVYKKPHCYVICKCILAC